MEPIDIWRAAKVLVNKHADQAVIECARKANAFLERGDPDGQRLWLAIRRAAKQLVQVGPPTDI
jgi:hypothetical protein